MIWEKGGTRVRGLSKSKGTPTFFVSHLNHREEDSLSFAVSFLVFAQKKPTTRSGGPLDVSSFVELDTKRKDDESGETYTEFFEKKKKRIGGGFFPVKCVFERDWKRNSFPLKPTLRRFGGRKRVANVVVARHGPKVRRSLSLSLCVCVCVSLFFVCSRQIPFGRARRSGHSFLIFEIGKKRVRRKPKKRADWLGKNLHMRIARGRLSCTTNTKRRLTTYKTCPPRGSLSLPSFLRQTTTTRARARESPGGRSRPRGSRRRHEKTRRAELPETLERSLER